MEQKRRKVGCIEQLAYIRNVSYQEGAAAGLEAYQVKNGPLQFSVALDKCLDILELSYKGINISFLSKNGLASGSYARGYRYSDKSVMGGMLFTCGTDNVGPGDVSRGLPVHGTLRSTSSRQRGAECFYDEAGAYHLRVHGVMEPEGLFEGHICLERVIETIYGTGKITVTDRFKNMGYVKEPWMLLYHCNFSYPFLDTCCRVRIDTASSVLREEMDRQTELPFDRIEEPVDGGVEQVFFHEARADEEGRTTVSVENPELGITASLRYEKDLLPRLIQWKSMVSGDYALGIEPANCLVFGRAYEEKHGTLSYLEPGEERLLRLELAFT